MRLAAGPNGPRRRTAPNAKRANREPAAPGAVQIPLGREPNQEGQGSPRLHRASGRGRPCPRPVP
eukprot:7048682-Alexandrium_andersonii.AAC.1